MFGVDPETLEGLQAIPLFADLSDAALACLARAAVRRTFAAGEIIIVEGDPCRAAYFIAEGQVRVFRTSPGGREQVLTRLGPGQAFNTVPPFLAQGRNHATVQAITRVVLYAPARLGRQSLLRGPQGLVGEPERSHPGRLVHNNAPSAPCQGGKTGSGDAAGPGS